MRYCAERPQRPKPQFCVPLLRTLATTAVFRFSQARLNRQLSLWRTHLPTVTPHYAVKSNHDPQLLRWIRAAGGRFDCASPREMEEVLRIGATPRDIIYAHPTKPPADIQMANVLGIPTTVVDSVEEVEKLATANWRGSVLIRLLVPDAGSAQPFSSKFGAPLTWVPSILKELRCAGIPHVGWSFHVGSVCGNPEQYRTAVRLCAEADTMAGQRASVVDIGGGFVPEEEPFAAAAAVLRAEQARWASKDTQWIAEPGRFLSAPVCDLEVDVIGVKPRVDGTGLRVTVDETIYGTFSNIPFDGQRPSYELLAVDVKDRPRVRTTLFGRTCDSADCLARDVELPVLRVGDRLRVSNMGAYTIVSASEFNGFPCPRRVYLP